MRPTGVVPVLAVLFMLPAALAFGQSASMNPSSNVAVMGKVTGAISFLDLKAQQPMLRLIDRQGKSLNIVIDPQLTAVVQNGQAARLDDLQIGQKVEISQTTKDGKSVAQTIEVLPAGSSSASATSDKPSTSGY